MDVLSKKNNDCYFYYYSTCLKGDGCMFRHEPSALGCETMCSFWQQGKCLNQHCNFRHMELRKNRKSIPCYWETQPGGCRKPHCPFLHKAPKDTANTTDHETNQDAVSEDRLNSVGVSTDSSQLGPRRVSQGSDSYGSPPVDPLVVNFEEESDNESVPTSTPTKKPFIKTLEQIRLEQVQAEQAALYGYKDMEQEEQAALHRYKDTEQEEQVALQRYKHLPDLRERLSRSIYQNANISVKSLKQIRAEKRETYGEKQDKSIIPPRGTSTADRKKRSHSPIVFDVSPKQIKNEPAQNVSSKKSDGSESIVASSKNIDEVNTENKSFSSNMPPIKLRRTFIENSGPLRFRRRGVKRNHVSDTVTVVDDVRDDVVSHTDDTHNNVSHKDSSKISNDNIKQSDEIVELNEGSKRILLIRRSVAEDEDSLLLDTQDEDEMKFEDDDILMEIDEFIKD